MNARLILVAGVVISGLFVLGAGRAGAQAQGVIYWDPGPPTYPRAVQPSPPPNFQLRGVDLLGGYTVNPGWVLVDAKVRLKLKPNGAAFDVIFSHNDASKIGALGPASSVVAQRISLMQPGTYEAILLVKYRTIGMPSTEAVSETTAVEFTVQ